jgi:phosphoesterase RecJ-like protein
VNYGLSIKNIVFAVIFIENRHEGIVKISLRSRGSFDVNAFARKHFEGGGHRNAAGGKSTDKLIATIKRFESLLPTYQTELLNA